MISKLSSPPLTTLQHHKRSSLKTPKKILPKTKAKAPTTQLPRIRLATKTLKTITVPRNSHNKRFIVLRRYKVVKKRMLIRTMRGRKLVEVRKVVGEVPEEGEGMGVELKWGKGEHRTWFGRVVIR